MLFSNIVELTQGEFLYKAGDPGGSFWFVLTGKIEVVIKTGEDFKYSKSVDENTFFGLKKFYGEPRIDYAKVASPKLQVIEFNTEKYNNIVQKTQLSTSEKKIIFLIRFVPGFRLLPRRLLEDFEVYFIKEQVSKGFQI